MKRLIKTGEHDADVACYIPGTIDLVFQGMVQKHSMIEQPTHTS